MLYQCWISPATASIHQRMNFSFLKNRAFSSAVFLDSTLLIFIKSVLAMARELRASTSSLVSLMRGRCFKPVSKELGDPRGGTVLKASLNDIAAQTNSTLLGKRLELLQLFFRTSVGVDFRRRFPYDFLLSHLSLSLIKMG